MRFRWYAMLAGFVLALSAAIAAAQTGRIGGPSWRLDVKFHDPQRLFIRLPGDQHETTFWYMLYEVTNNTRQDVEFFPSFQLVTDTLRVVRAGDDISPSVYDAIAARHKREFPFFAPPAKVTGVLLQGQENARASAAVFRMFDKEASGFTVFGTGFSGEAKRLPNPAFKVTDEETEENPRFFMLRRTLALVYGLPGDRETRWRAKPIRRTREWVMR